MKELRYLPEADAELNDALAVSRDPQAFRVVLDAALGDVASGLRQHAAIGRTRFRECILPGLPYTVVYFETADTIEVVAVSHHRRRRGYWKNRLGPG